VTTKRMARALLGQLRELLAAAEAGAVPDAGPAYRHRVEGAVTALEAVLGEPSSLVPGLVERPRAPHP